jgi:antitoxin (DNA-binding transcriptional repressor) of toxin-antitoxin stability system
MKTMTIREAREGLSHPEQMFADSDEVLVVCRGEPVARILPVTPAATAAGRKAAFRSLAAFRATIPFQETPSEVLIREDRDARG